MENVKVIPGVSTDSGHRLLLGDSFAESENAKETKVENN